MSSKIDLTPNENGFISYRDIVDQHRANEAEAKKSEPTQTESNPEAAAASPEPKDEVEVVEKGFFESLIDDAGDVAKSGVHAARGALDEAEKRLDGAIDSGAEAARELDQKISAAKTGVTDAAREINDTFTREAELLEQDFSPVLEDAKKVVRNDIENMIQMKARLVEVKDEIADSAGRSVERHLGEGAGEFVRETISERDVIDGLVHATFTRHFDSPAEIGDLADNPISKVGIDVGLAVTAEVAPFLKEVANSPGASSMFSMLMPPSVPFTSTIYEEVVLPQLNATLDGAVVASQDPEAFRQSITCMSSANLTAKLDILEPGQTATMSIGGELSVHAGIGGKIGLGTGLDIKHNDDGSYSVTVRHEETLGAGIGAEAAGAGAAVNGARTEIETVTYRAQTKDAALILLGVKDGSSMEQAARASDEITLEARLTTYDAGVSAKALGGAGANLVMTSGYVDSDLDGNCDEAFREISKGAGVGVAHHVNVGNVFNEDDRNPAVPHLGGGDGGWLDADAERRIEQMITSEFGETGVNLEVKTEIKAAFFSTSSVFKPNEARAEFTASTSLRNGNDVVAIETTCKLQKPVDLARALGCSSTELALMVENGTVSPRELGTIAASLGLQDSVVIETRVLHRHSKGPSIDLAGAKVRDQIETETVLGELSSQKLVAHELAGNFKI